MLSLKLTLKCHKQPTVLLSMNTSEYLVKVSTQARIDRMFWTKQAVKNRTKNRKAVTKKMSLRPRCRRSTLSSAFNASFQTYRASKTFRTVLSLKLSHVKLPKAAFVVHVADLPEYVSLRPALVVDAANRPHTTYETKMQQSVWECGRKRMHIWSNKSK